MKRIRKKSRIGKRLAAFSMALAFTVGPVICAQGAWQQRESGKWYYYDDSGVMQTGWILIDNGWYYLKASGEMASNEWIGGYYVGSDGTWQQEQRRELVKVTFSDFDVTVREDIDGDGWQEWLSLEKTYNGIKIHISFMERDPMVINFDGVFTPLCEITACDLGTGTFSMFIQAPTIGNDEAYWAKCFIGQNGAFTEVLVPEYRFTGSFTEDNHYQVFCENTAFSAQGESPSGDGFEKGRMLHSMAPDEYKLEYNSEAGGYLVEIRQELMSDAEDTVPAAEVQTTIRYNGSGWNVVEQKIIY